MYTLPFATTEPYSASTVTSASMVFAISALGAMITVLDMVVSPLCVCFENGHFERMPKPCFTLYWDFF